MSPTPPPRVNYSEPCKCLTLPFALRLVTINILRRNVRGARRVHTQFTKLSSVPADTRVPTHISVPTLPLRVGDDNISLGRDAFHISNPKRLLREETLVELEYRGTGARTVY